MTTFKAPRFLLAPLLLACALAQAQTSDGVQIYGVLDMFGGQLRSQTGTAPAQTSTVLNNGGMTTSFLGFSGKEDLGDGLRAVFGLESFIRADTGAIGRNDADTFFARLAIVGLEGPWGKVTLGRHVTPYSLATTLNTPFVGSTTLSPVFAHVYNLNLQGGTRFDNAVQYSTPNLGGVTADFIYALGLENSSASVDPKRDRAYEAVARYVNGPFRGTVGTHYINLNSNRDGHDQTAWMVAGVYDFRAVKLNAQFHNVKDKFALAASNATRKTQEYGVTVPVGPGNILATYVRSTMADNSAATPDARKSFSLGYDHYLSKRTDLYAAWYSDKLFNPQTTQRIIAVGIRHRF